MFFSFAYCIILSPSNLLSFLQMVLTVLNFVNRSTNSMVPIAEAALLFTIASKKDLIIVVCSFLNCSFLVRNIITVSMFLSIVNGNDFILFLYISVIFETRDFNSASIIVLISFELNKGLLKVR